MNKAKAKQHTPVEMCILEKYKYNHRNGSVFIVYTYCFLIVLRGLRDLTSPTRD